MKSEIDEKLRALDELARLGGKIGPVSGDPISEARTERNAEQAQVLRGG